VWGLKIELDDRTVCLSYDWMIVYKALMDWHVKLILFTYCGI